MPAAAEFVHKNHRFNHPSQTHCMMMALNRFLMAATKTCLIYSLYAKEQIEITLTILATVSKHDLPISVKSHDVNLTATLDSLSRRMIEQNLTLFNSSSSHPLYKLAAEREVPIGSLTVQVNFFKRSSFLIYETMVQA